MFKRSINSSVFSLLIEKQSGSGENSENEIHKFEKRKEEIKIIIYHKMLVPFFLFDTVIEKNVR